jgi:hypothetical protein
MIISKIYQGLGNQLFQYAYGKARAIELNVEFKIDTSYYENYSEVTQFGYTYKRDFGLNRFQVTAKEATAEEIDAVLHPIGKSILHKLSNRLRLKSKKLNKKFYIKENIENFSPELLNILDNTYVEGYFTNEKYFKNIKSILVKEFTLIDPPTDVNQEIIQEMENCNSICISIRRTNFLNNPLHGTCGEAYYYDAMKLMASKVENPIFYVFSDDNEWINTFFDSQGFECRFIQHNYPDFYEDFRLMTNCKHHIIPNSTFPWWAAWLSENESKIVIAPKYWLNSNEIDYSDYIPSDWLKLNHDINTLFTGDK